MSNSELKLRLHILIDSIEDEAALNLVHDFLKKVIDSKTDFWDNRQNPKKKKI